MKPTPDGPPAVPPVQHLVVRYAKRGKMRFASHRDVARAFERGVRRAGVPIAHSAGFTPHPKISYAGGAPTGVASEAEYLSLALTSRSDPAAVRERLNAALPDGIEVINVSEGAGGLPASQLVASEWQVILPGLPPRDVAPAVQEFLALEHAEVERLTSKGMRRMDARPAVVSIDLLASDMSPVTSLGRGCDAANDREAHRPGYPPGRRADCDARSFRRHPGRPAADDAGGAGVDQRIRGGHAMTTPETRNTTMSGSTTRADLCVTVSRTVADPAAWGSEHYELPRGVPPSVNRSRSWRPPSSWTHM